ncbi:MAG: prolipoprotein diacylglyceryl transferase [Clostridia bacterium]|nr:prolipoprotein diacylglyceryl transferase [Clostridia bacterium]
MRFLTGHTLVSFPGLGWEFDVYANLLEIPMGDGVITIKFYGVLIALGLILAALFGGRKAYTWKMSLDSMIDVLIYGIIGAVVGARLYYVIFQWDYYKDNLGDIFKIWEGGLAIYGGIIGGIIVAYFVCKKTGLKFIKLLDLFGMSLLIGQGIGRWGNFTNQEAFGTNTTLPWGMTSDKIVAYINNNQADFIKNGIEMDPNLPVHPTFLYESLWCLLGFVVLYIVCQKFYKFDGQLFLGYGIIYGIERTIVEGLRTDSLYIGDTNLRVSQVLSLAIVVVCVALTIYKFIKLKKSKTMEVQENV